MGHRAAAALIRHFEQGSSTLRDEAVGTACVFGCHARDHIRNVRFPEPGLILVASGSKEFHLDGRLVAARAGDAIALSPVEAVDVVNIPPEGGLYRSVLISFAPSLLRAFRLSFPHLVEGGRPPRPFALLRSDRLAEAADHALSAFAAGPKLSVAATRHRMTELLILLAEHGIAWRPEAEERVAERLRLLIGAQPAAPWSAAEAARRLGLSEPTLRRRLRAEGTGFTRVLSDTRLDHALTLLYGGAGPIAQVAQACGYRSASRFAGLFRARFGLIPSATRAAPAPGPVIDRIGAVSDRNGTMPEATPP